MVNNASASRFLLPACRGRWRSASQVDGSSHFKLLGWAFAGSLLELVPVYVRDEAVDLHSKHAVPLRDHCHTTRRRVINTPVLTQSFHHYSVATASIEFFIINGSHFQMSHLNFRILCLLHVNQLNWSVTAGKAQGEVFLLFIMDTWALPAMTVGLCAGDFQWTCLTFQFVFFSDDFEDVFELLDEDPCSPDIWRTFGPHHCEAGEKATQRSQAVTSYDLPNMLWNFWNFGQKRSKVTVTLFRWKTIFCVVFISIDLHYHALHSAALSAVTCTDYLSASS